MSVNPDIFRHFCQGTWLPRSLVPSWVFHSSEPAAFRQHRTAVEWSGFEMMERCKCAVLVLLSASRLIRAKGDGVLWIFTLECSLLLSGSTAGMRQCQSCQVCSLGTALFLTLAVAEQPLKRSSAMGCGGSILKRCLFSLGKY